MGETMKMTEPQGMTEADALQRVVTELQARGYAVWQEVPMVVAGSQATADLVAMKDGEWAIIEGKRWLNAELARQCARWLPFAHRVWAAVLEPAAQSVNHQRFRSMLGAAGVGLLYVPRGDDRKVIRALLPVRRSNPDVRILEQAVHADQQPGGSGPDAGASAAKRVRPDRWDAVREHLADCPGATVKELAAACDLSKADARDLGRLAKRGELRGIRVDRKAAPFTYWLTGYTPHA